MGNGYMDPQVATGARLPRTEAASSGQEAGSGWDSNAARREALSSASPPEEPMSTLLFDAAESTAVSAGWIAADPHKTPSPS